MGEQKGTQEHPGTEHREVGKEKEKNAVGNSEQRTGTNPTSGKGVEADRKENKGAQNIEQYWEELEKVLENIGMDDIWLEKNEPEVER